MNEKKNEKNVSIINNIPKIVVHFLLDIPRDFLLCLLPFPSSNCNVNFYAKICGFLIYKLFQLLL